MLSLPEVESHDWPAPLAPGTDMRAVVMRAFGAPDVLRLETVRTPEPAAGEVLVQVAAVSVGRFLDVAARGGRHPYPGYTFPHIFGAEHAGVVATLGRDVDPGWLGKRVAVFPNVSDGTCRLCLRGYDELCPALQLIGMHRPGAYAQYVAVPTTNLHEVPAGITPEQASGLALSGAVVLNQLQRSGFTRGQWVLVQGAAGALGLLTVALVLHLGGHVIASSRRASKRSALLELGVDAALDPSDTDFVAKVQALTGGFGADLVVDNLGAVDIWTLSLASLASGGTVVSSGAFLGRDVPVDLRQLYIRGQRILGVRTGNLASVAALWEEVGRGFRPILGTTFPLEQAEHAHRVLEGDDNVGRVSLLVR